jgi:enoyl-CoA hydratase/carnithine racemase
MNPLLIEVADRIATLTINRPDVRNALDRETVAAITAALADLGGRADVGAVIFTGAGDAVFVAGADIRQMGAAGRWADGDQLVGVCGHQRFRS